jgi:hypothetical protein
VPCTDAGTDAETVSSGAANAAGADATASVPTKTTRPARTEPACLKTAPCECLSRTFS